MITYKPTSRLPSNIRKYFVFQIIDHAKDDMTIGQALAKIQIKYTEATDFLESMMKDHGDNWMPEYTDEFINAINDQNNRFIQKLYVLENFQKEVKEKGLTNKKARLDEYEQLWEIARK
jgi:hypothetical protein